MADSREVKLSKRGEERFASLWAPNTSWGKQHFDKEHNPDGLIRVNSAENLLLNDVLLKYVHEHFDLSDEHLKYRIGLVNSFHPTLIDALPRFLNRTLKPREPITPEATVIGPGVGGLLAHLLWVLTDPGDGIVMTTPFYSTYNRDIFYPAQAVPVLAHIPPDVDPLSPAVLPFVRKAIEEQEGIRRCSAIILCNPHNPLGRAYPVETIIGFAGIAEEFDLHLVCDELFANQIFSSRLSPNPTPFTSILSINPVDLKCNPARIHVLATPTKDFGASGLKLGGLVSQHNESVTKCVRDALLATPVSAAADAIFTAVLNDEAFCDSFLEENRVKLAEAFEFLVDWCNFHKFPFLTTEAGVFTLVDLASAIKKSEDQSLLIKDQVANATKRLLKEGVLMAACNDTTHTRFRMIFSFPKRVMKASFRMPLVTN
ncbi:hypothetical protein AAF712_011314 [Marasmius tenuissimus]|uniref:Aminotransferase class I/classII large domain-containing protein n=1 Tax=Marasmius tenuissimus TaxID=585030 RepID=A0ABR2ZN32_9AGAR